MSLKRQLARWLILITPHQLVWSSITSMLMKKMVIIPLRDRYAIFILNPIVSVGHIVVDVCALEDGSIADVTLDTLSQNYPDSRKPKSRRYVLPLASGNTVCYKVYSLASSPGFPSFSTLHENIETIGREPGDEASSLQYDCLL